MAWDRSWAGLKGLKVALGARGWLERSGGGARLEAGSGGVMSLGSFWGYRGAGSPREGTSLKGKCLES